MNLDWRVCSRARLARDARFDGKFFIGVLSTRIYCRPICRSRTSRESNVRYFPTAAAAAEAGFRPCLRCRPECSPGTPAWLGTPVTVSRALRLIEESGIDDGGMELLAERLGVGTRHLRRLFLRHLGATPSAVARTRRLHFAKKLISETNLPMSQIALAAGFGTVRRFNAGIRQTFHRTPTHIRRLSRQTDIQRDNEYNFRLGFRPPYDWKGMLAFLSARATPGIESVDARSYSRSISLNGCHGYFEVSRDERENMLAIRLQFDNPRFLFFIVERIRAMFDLNADLAVITRGLRVDPVLRFRVQAHPGLRVPGCWSGFELTAGAILTRHLSLKTARAVAHRLVTAFGQPFPIACNITHLFPGPEVLAAANLARVGLSPERSECLRSFARAVCEGRICFEGVADSGAFRDHLCLIPGIDRSTAEYVVMRAIGEPDAFPSADHDLLHALALRDPSDLEVLAEAWRPWRAYAAMHIWAIPPIRARSHQGARPEHSLAV